MKAIIYCRVACEEQLGTRLAEQERACMDYAKKHGFTVVKTISEVGSGMDLRRQGLQEMLRLVKQQKVKKIIMTDISRLTRDYTHLKLLLGKLF